MIPQRSIVSRTIPQRSVASRTIPQRSVASRTIPQRSIVSRMVKNGCCLSDSYNWGNIIDNTLTFNKKAKAYNLPNLNSGVVYEFYPGDKINIYSYVNSAGRTWLMFYLNVVDYQNFNASYIPLSGNPASSTNVPADSIQNTFDTTGIMTQEQIDAQNQPLIDKIFSNIKTIALIGGSIYLISKVLKK